MKSDAVEDLVYDPEQGIVDPLAHDAHDHKGKDEREEEEGPEKEGPTGPAPHQRASNKPTATGAIVPMITQMTLLENAFSATPSPSILV